MNEQHRALLLHAQFIQMKKERPAGLSSPYPTATQDYNEAVTHRSGNPFLLGWVWVGFMNTTCNLQIRLVERRVRRRYDHLQQRVGWPSSGCDTVVVPQTQAARAQPDPKTLPSLVGAGASPEERRFCVPISSHLEVELSFGRTRAGILREELQRPKNMLAVSEILFYYT